MKSAKRLKEMYDKWQHIDAMYKGEKSDWREIHSQLLSLEFNLKELILRKDDNLLFCEYIKRKLLEDIKEERYRLENQYGKYIFR